MTPLHIDLNADVGESLGAHPCQIGDDAALMPLITSASVAACMHAGDPSVLRQAVRLARTHGVAVGAHPGYPDLVGFGRRVMQLSPGTIEDLVLYQIAAVAGVAAAEGIALQHVKPHGALYTVAALDAAVAGAVARAVHSFEPRLLLFGPPASQLEYAAASLGLRFVREGFADRAYESDGSLVSRQHPGAVLADPDAAAEQAARLAVEGAVVAHDGRRLPLSVETLCLHGDTPGAATIAAAVRSRLLACGVAVQRPGAPGASGDRNPSHQ